MRVDLSQHEILVLLCLIEQETERGATALRDRDLAGCINAMPPRVLNPLKDKLEKIRCQAATDL